MQSNTHDVCREEVIANETPMTFAAGQLSRGAGAHVDIRLDVAQGADHDPEVAFLGACFDELFPIMRSITGQGLRDSLEIFRRYMAIDRESVASGSAVFDWVAPPEWQFERARLWAPDGSVVCDTDINNLHILNYSEPVDMQISLDELQPRLHSIPAQPDAIPYVTSYYQRTWGLCLSDRERRKLQPGRYRVLIESKFDEDGSVDFATGTLPGRSTREILLSSYLCHPSMANNELSGPLVMLALYRRLQRWPDRRFTYRFTLAPETIGSLCFLSRYHKLLRENLQAGLVLTCVGGPATSLRYLASRRGNTELDQLMRRFADQREPLAGLPLNCADFNPCWGSDERQYCAPGFNLPIGQIARTAYGQFPEYHTSLDTREFMGIDKLVETVDTIERILLRHEWCGHPVNQSAFGEPQLGRRGLYPNLNSQATRDQSSDDSAGGRVMLNRLLKVLSRADGQASTLAMADACACDLQTLSETLATLENGGLLDFDGTPLA